MQARALARQHARRHTRPAARDERRGQGKRRKSGWSRPSRMRQKWHSRQTATASVQLTTTASVWFTGHPVSATRDD
eukprot:6214025-Pleurochrysis_carterae.AAC.7